MKKSKLENTGKSIRTRFLLLGHIIRMRALKKLAKTNAPGAIPYMVEAINSFDLKVAEFAEEALRNLKNKDAIEVLCNGIIEGTMDAAKSLSVEMNYQPGTVSRRCLFFVISGQMEKYLELDYDFEYLRAEYQAATEDIKNRIRLSIQQSNDNRLIGLFGEIRKKFVVKDLTEHEARLMLEVYNQNGQMEEIFALMFFAPLRIVIKALDILKKSTWRPEEEREELIESIFKIREEMGENPQFPAQPEVTLGPVFQKWIKEGLSETYINKTDEKLREIFSSGDPAAAVTALTSLIEKNLLTPDDRKKAKNHPHWMARLAYASLNNWSRENIFFESHEFSTHGGEYWIKKLVPAIISNSLSSLKAANIDPEMLQVLIEALNKLGRNPHILKYWAMLLVELSGYTLRNTITIGNYEKRIEDSAIIISSNIN